MALGSRERIGLERILLVFEWPTEVGWGVGAAAREREEGTEGFWEVRVGGEYG